MKFEKTTLFALTGLLLALAIGVSSYFLFYRKESKTSREIARETELEIPASGNAVQGPIPETLDPEEEAEENAEPKNSLPIPFIVKTNSVNRLNNSVQIISKSYHLPSQPDCEDFSFTWEEIKLPNKQITARLNKIIREEIKLMEDNGEDVGPGKIPAEFCNGEGEYEFRGTLSLFGNLLHATYYNFTLFRGAAHPGSVLETNCFDIKTGKKVNLHQLIKPNRIAELDSLVVIKPATQENGEIRGDLSAAFREQLPDLDFEFSDKGLVVIVKGVSYVTTRLTLDLDLKETAYFLKPEIFEMVYGKQNSGTR